METKTLEQLSAVPSSRDETPLFQALKRLGFDSYEPQVAEALKACEQMDPPASPRTVLTIALAAVIRVRDSHKCEMRLKMARFPSLKTLEEFDFSVFSDKRIGGRVHELAAGDYLREHFNILIHGAAGLGKTHLSISLGIRATQQAYSTLFIEAKELFSKLEAAVHDGSYTTKIRSIQRYDLLIIDDFGVSIVPNPLHGRIFADLMKGRAGKKSTIINSSRTMPAWIAALGGEAKDVRSAAERFLFHCYDIELAGKSYRLGNFMKQRKKDWNKTDPGEFGELSDLE